MDGSRSHPPVAVYYPMQKNIEISPDLQITIAQSTRTDGNMSFARGTEKETVRNRSTYLDSFNLNLKKLIAPRLVHGNNCVIADSSHTGCGAFSFADAIPETDALVTAETDLILSVTTADCLPVYLWSDDGEVIGIAHAGWKGLVEGVLKSLIQKARGLHNISLNRFYLHIGIGVGLCCYVIDKERLKKFLGYPMCEIHWREDESAHLNLAAVAKVQSRRQGIPEENVTLEPGCTACGNIYPSYRRDGENVRPDLAFIVKTRL